MLARRSAIAFFTLLASACAVSCAAVLGFERLSTEDGVVADGGPDASDANATRDASDAEVDAGPCGEIGIPAEPVDAAAGGGPAVYIAVRQLDFGVDPDGGAGDVPGFNLDRACSINAASSTCKTNVLDPTFEKHAKDKSAVGLDNAGFSLIQFITNLPSDLLTSTKINQGIADGKYGAVVRITNWTGAPDDGDVQIEIFPAIGVLPRANPDAGFQRDDQWVLDSRFLIAVDVLGSSIRSERAWVTGGRLVARFKDAYLPIVIDEDPKPFDIHMNDVVLTATLATTNGETTLTGGTVAGRWKTAEFLSQVRTIYVKKANGLEDTVLCEPKLAAQFLYGNVKKEVCDARDIRSDSNDGANVGCDGVSAAMRLEGYPLANLGVFDAGAPVPPRCEVDGAVPLGDDCAPN